MAAPAPQKPTPPTQKTTLAAAIFLVMFVVSAAVALWSGYLLMHGEEAELVFAALPARCDWVVLVDHPDEVEPAWNFLANARQLPETVTTTAREQASSWRELAATPGLDPKRSWALCGRPDGVVAALVAREGQATQPGQAWLDRLWRQRWPKVWQDAGLDSPWIQPQAGTWTQDQGRTAYVDPTGRALAAVQREGELVRVAWAAPGHDAHDVLAAAVAEARTDPLQKNENVRAAFERVGGGQLHLYTSSALVRAAGKHLQASAEVQQGLELVKWFSVVLRRDETGVRVHTQLGTGPQGAVWLKDRLDPLGPPMDAAPLLPADTRLAVIVRVNPKRLPLTDLPGVAWLDGLLKAQVGVGLARASEVATGQAVYLQHGDPQRWAALLQVREGPVAAALRTGAHLGTGAEGLAGDHVLWAAEAASIEALRAAVTGKRPLLEGVTRDQKRLLGDTQGVFLKKGASLGPLRGPLQIEWLWLDTGLVAEASVPVR